MGLPASTTQRDFVRLVGGWDMVTPDLSIDPGAVRESLNFEPDMVGGYRRIAGYERFDGHPQPHQQSFVSLPVSVESGVAPGTAVVGETSGATGLVIEHTDGVLYLTMVVGTFAEGEGVAPAGETTGPMVLETPSGDEDALRRTKLAQDHYRDLIGPVPGSGPVAGVFMLDEVAYAIRAGVLHRATADGWEPVNLGVEVQFSAAQAEIFAGDAIVGATSGATATVLRVARRTGSWGSDAVGTLVLADLVGSFVQGEAIQRAAATVATAASKSAAITLPEGGRYEFDVFGSKVYGASGAGPAFEFDGEVFVLIRTGMAPDAPSRVCFHQNHLFLAFDGSLQFSSIGDPYQWSPLTGAGELVVRAPITALLRQPGSEGGGALAVATESNLSILYGTSAADWQLVEFQSETGALAGSMQNIGIGLMLSPRGVAFIGQSQAFGNFEHSILSAKISPWLQPLSRGTVASCVIRGKNQYRLFFSGGTGLVMTLMGREVVGAMPFSYPVEMRCVFNQTLAGGGEMVLAGSSDGYVYRLDVGASFDGAAIPAYLELPYNANRSLRARKRYRRALFEVESASTVRFLGTTSFALGDADIAPHEGCGSRMPLTGGKWDDSRWDAFYWDGMTNRTPVRMCLDGSGDNFSMFIYSDSAKTPSWVIRSLIVEYSVRRGER